MEGLKKSSDKTCTRGLPGALIRAVVTLAKTGVRRGELISLDVDDIDWQKMSIKLKPTANRSNRLVFFDEETKQVLMEWMNMRRL